MGIETERIICSNTNVKKGMKKCDFCIRVLVCGRLQQYGQVAMERAGLEPIDVGMCSCMQNPCERKKRKKKDKDKEKANFGRVWRDNNFSSLRTLVASEKYCNNILIINDMPNVEDLQDSNTLPTVGAVACHPVPGLSTSNKC